MAGGFCLRKPGLYLCKCEDSVRMRRCKDLEDAADGLLNGRVVQLPVSGVNQAERETLASFVGSFAQEFFVQAVSFAQQPLEPIAVVGALVLPLGNRYQQTHVRGIRLLSQHDVTQGVDKSALSFAEQPVNLAFGTKPLLPREGVADKGHGVIFLQPRVWSPVWLPRALWRPWQGPTWSISLPQSLPKFFLSPILRLSGVLKTVLRGPECMHGRAILLRALREVPLRRHSPS